MTAPELPSAEVVRGRDVAALLRRRAAALSGGYVMVRLSKGAAVRAADAIDSLADALETAESRVAKMEAVAEAWALFRQRWPEHTPSSAPWVQAFDAGCDALDALAALDTPEASDGVNRESHDASCCMEGISPGAGPHPDCPGRPLRLPPPDAAAPEASES